jgi:hypothetical protein
MNATSKLVKAWESKNARNAAKAGGISMMALSLAACGGSSTTTTTTTDTTTTDTTTTVVAGVQKSLLSTTDLQTGGAGDDTFYGLNSGDFATGDIVDGGEGDDTLIASYTSVDGTTQAIRPVLSNLETVQLTITDGNTGGDTATLNLDQSTGVTNVVFGNKAFVGSADTIVLSGATTAVGVTIQDDAGHASANANNYTMTYSDAATGTSDTASVAVKMTTADGALGNVTVANVETVTVSASGGFDASYNLVADAATSITLNAAADSLSTDTNVGAVNVQSATATSLTINASNDVTVTDATTAAAKLFNVTANATTATSEITLTTLTPTATATSDTFTVTATGAGTVVYTAENTNFGAQTATNADAIVVNGSENTGGITADLDGVTTGAPDTLTVTGGSGNDTVLIAAGALDDEDTIALGGGTGDTIAVVASYASNAAIDLFHDDDVTTTDPTITGAEIARITLADTGAASTVATTSASWASTIELMGDLDNAGSTINNILATQTVKLGSTLNMTDASSSLTLVQEGATASAPAASLTITSDLMEDAGGATDANIDDLRANVATSVSLDLASTDADVVSVTVDGASFDKATSVTVTSAENVTFGAIDAADDATLDFTGVTGTLSVSADTANNYTIKGSASGVNTIIMSTGLDNDDVITGGSAATDSLTATVAGLTATTGALSISGVETIQLDTATSASSINAAGIVGASTIAVGSAQSVTLTNLEAGTNLQLGVTGSLDYSTQAVLTASLADATGSNDAITVSLSDTASDGDISAGLSIAGVETVTLADATTAGTGNNKNIAVANVAATTLNVTGGTASEILNLTTDGNTGSQLLNAATTTVDASGFLGVLTASAATNTATTFTAKTTVGTLTGGAVADTFTIASAGAELGASLGTIAGGTGADTLTAYVKGSADLTGVTAVETINLVATSTSTDYSSSNATVTWAGGAVGSSPTGAQTATTVNISGGLASNTVTLSGGIGDNGARTVDASSLAGSIIMTFLEDGLVQTNNADAIVIRGGAGTLDVVNVGAAGVDTGQFTMSGVEKLVIDSDTGANTVNLLNVTGLTTIVAQDDAGTATGINIDNAASSGLTIQIGTAAGADYAGATIDVDLLDASGASDSITVSLAETTASSGATVDTTGIETVNIVASAAAASSAVSAVSIAGTVTAGTINVSGTNANDEVTLEAVAAGYTTINAANLVGDLVVAATARGSDAMTITGGTGADTIEMENAADVITGGAGTVSDDLHVTFSGTGGAIVVDLSSTTDQVTLFNGVANSAAQTGFEDIDVSAYVQTGSVGADITGTTGANVITGTGYADTIRGGAGDDVISGGVGADIINVGTGADTVSLASATDSFTAAVVLGTTVLSGSVQVVTGMGDGDKVTFTTASITAATGVALDTAVQVTTGSAAGDDIGLIRGNYASDGKFTAGTAGTDNDYLVSYLEGTGTDAISHVVLMDIVGTVTSDTLTNGIELNVA